MACSKRLNEELGKEGSEINSMPKEKERSVSRNISALGTDAAHMHFTLEFG